MTGASIAISLRSAAHGESDLQAVESPFFLAVSSMRTDPIRERVTS
jgi:hypothetical protein